MAGTIVVDTVQGGSGGSFDPDDIANGWATTWVNFNGTGTIAIRDSKNVSSLTDNGTGDYDVNLTATVDTNGACVMGSSSSSTVPVYSVQGYISGTTTVVLNTGYVTTVQVNADAEWVSMAIFEG